MKKGHRRVDPERGERERASEREKCMGLARVHCAVLFAHLRFCSGRDLENNFLETLEADTFQGLDLLTILYVA